MPKKPQKPKNTNRNKIHMKKDVQKEEDVKKKEEEDVKDVNKEESFKEDIKEDFQEDVKDVKVEDDFENWFLRNRKKIFSGDELNRNNKKIFSGDELNELNLNLATNKKLAETFKGFSNMFTHRAIEEMIKRMEEETLDFNNQKDIEKAKKNVNIIQNNIIDSMQFKTNNAEKTSAIINEFNENMKNNKDIEKAEQNYNIIIKMVETLNTEAFLIKHISDNLKFVKQCEDLIDNYITHGGVDVKNYTAKEVGEIPRDIQTDRAAFMFYVNNRANFSKKTKQNLEHKTGFFWLSAEERRENELLDYANNKIQSLRNIHSGVLFPCCCA